LTHQQRPEAGAILIQRSVRNRRTGINQCSVDPFAGDQLPVIPFAVL
jgi:hypothetical protein